MSSQNCLKILIVDDEPLARDRLRTLLGDIAPHVPNQIVGEAGNGLEALAFLAQQPVDVVFADIRMPGMDGIELAAHLGRLGEPPRIVFTTAYDNYAVQAFDLNAVDYLLKPIRLQRLLSTMQKLAVQLPEAGMLSELGQAMRGRGRSHLSCHERGRLLLVPVKEILYLKADLKYVTARTAEREFLLDEALTRLEEEFSEQFIRLHRSVLVARSALSGFERAAGDDAEAYGWALLRGIPEKLPVSRRQWAPAKAAMVALA